MAAFNMDKEFEKLDTSNTEVSPLVRARLDETYALLSKQQTSGSGRAKASSGLRKFTFATAAAGILGVAAFSSAFVSPVMADALRSIPVINSIFSTIQGDIGLRTAGDLGLTASVNEVVSYEDVSLEVTETLYDGSRAVVLLNVSAPNLNDGIYNNGKKDMRLSQAIDNMFLTIDGKSQNNVFYGSAGEAHPNTLIIEQVVDPASTPDAFQSEMTIKLSGIDHEFVVDIPFVRTTQQAIQTSPNIVTEDSDYTFTVAEVSVTPITTRITTSIALTDAESLTSKQEKRLIKLGVAVFDDQGRQLTALNGEGVLEGNELIFDRRYASTPGASQYYTVKPFVIKDDFAEDVQEDQFLKELETKIVLPAAN